MSGSFLIIDEKIINASPQHVWDALMAEFKGARNFWVPENTFVSGRLPPDTLGGTTEVTVHTRGVDRRGLKIRFTAKTVEIEPCRRLVTKYVAGALRGSATYRLVPLEAGLRTKLSIQFEPEPNGFAKVLSKPIKAEHSKAADAAFRRLSALLWTDAPAAGITTRHEAVLT